MTLRNLAYQQGVMNMLDAYLEELCEQRQKAEKIRLANEQETDPDLKRGERDFTEMTWGALKGKLPSSRRDVPFSARRDGVGRPVPNIVYKVPTGGGKTYLATSSISRIFSKYLNTQNGFVLWIVPNEAIYSQTLKQLTNREHPYRQMLNNLAGAPKDVKIMEKTTPLSAQDVEQSLCVMLLMLQSSNRQNKATLKIFRERGDVNGFLPPEDNHKAHQELKNDTPNLDVYDLVETSSPWLPVKESLGNALRVTQPVVILDEGHKAVSDLAYSTLYDFNPRFVLELTATPKDTPKQNRYQNILVEISGTELDREGMLKMPINLDSQQKTQDWKATLKVALDRLENLSEKAEQFRADSNRYIRPIMLVQVERTGADQRDGVHIHAEDVREWLITYHGMRDHEIARKTAQKDDLKDLGNQELLSEANQVRVIITKQALQEGWDCSFAYVLCSLAKTQNTTAMTQIMGRILRQPDAQKTGVPELDQCYIITHHGETGAVVSAIKKGLEAEGLKDLQGNIQATFDGVGTEAIARKIERREEFRAVDIFLPKVLRTTEDETRELDYETDILYPLDWHDLDVTEFVERVPESYQVAERQLYRIGIDRSEQERADLQSNRAFDAVRITRHISEIVQNPWVAYGIVERVRNGLEGRGFSAEKLGQFSSFVESELRTWLSKRRDERAEARFRAEVKEARIQFRLRTDNLNWRMPKTIETTHPERTQRLMRFDRAVQKSLFDEVYEVDFNSEEKKVALFLDESEMIKWWHRNAARHHYHIQGWMQNKIYPDFILSVHQNGNNEKYVVLETKGEHIKGSDDTEYKKKVLGLLKEKFLLEDVKRVGEMEIVSEDNISVVCEMVVMSEYKRRLSEIVGKE